jgi:hypothetical protein
MLRHLSIAALLVVAANVSSTGQPPARRVNLTGTVIAVNQQSDTVTLIDLKTMEAYRHVPVVAGPHEAAASPDGRSVVVTNYNKQGAGQQKTLSVIALPSGDTIKTIDLGEYRAPHDVRWVDPTHVVVTSEANQALLLVNVTSGAIERVFRTEAGVSHMLALSTDRTRLYCSNMRDGSVSAFDFKTGAKIKDVKTGKDSVTGLPLPRAVHPRRQARAGAARQSLVTRRARRREPIDSEIDQARTDQGGRAVHGRRLPASRQPARVRDGAQRQLDAGARPHQRRNARPRRGAG